MNALLTGLEYSSVGLQAALLFFLLQRGNSRRYIELTAYVSITLAATVAEMIVLSHGGTGGLAYRHLYMSDEVILDLLLFWLVIAMTRRAMGENPLRHKLERLLTLAVVGAVALPFALFSGPIFGVRWFNQTSQMLNFGAAIMNLALWTALLGNKRRDPLLLAVSAGVGLAVTGAAISYGLFHFKWFATGMARQMVNLMKGSTNIASLLIWCRAFGPIHQTKDNTPPACLDTSA